MFTTGEGCWWGLLDTAESSFTITDTGFCRVLLSPSYLLKKQHSHIHAVQQFPADIWWLPSESVGGEVKKKSCVVVMVDNLGCSEHYMVQFRISHVRNKTLCRISTSDFRRANFDLYKDALGDTLWVKDVGGKFFIMRMVRSCPERPWMPCSWRCLRPWAVWCTTWCSS